MLWGKVGINIDTYIHVAWLCTHLGDLRFRNTRVWVIVDPISTLVLLMLHVHVRSWLIAFRANFIRLKCLLILSFSTRSCPGGLLLRSTSPSERLFLTSACWLHLWGFWLFLLFTTILCAALTFIYFAVIFSKLWVLFYKAVINLYSEFVGSSQFL